MAVNTPSTKRSTHRRLIAVSLMIAPMVLCLSAALWAEFAPHYIPLERVHLLNASEWSSVTMNMVAHNNNRFSIWFGDATICAAQPNLCQGRDQADVMQQLIDWFIQHGWKMIQRPPATDWNACDNMVAVQKRSNLVFEQQGGWYYNPTVCVMVEPNPTTAVGYVIRATTINPSPLTMWSD